MTAPPADNAAVEATRTLLEQSRAALLAALEGVTERDFTAELEPGTTMIAALAALAPAEREAVRDARVAIGAPERPLPAGGASVTGRATPPQVVHDLAGARYETLLFLDYLEGAQRPPDGAIAAALEAIAAREAAVSGQIAARGAAAAETAHPA